MLKGEVWLLGNHHRLPAYNDPCPIDTLRGGGHRLTEKMLKWPMFGREQIQEQLWLDVYHAALQGFSINGFVTAITLFADVDKQQLHHPKREWGTIIHASTNKRVLTFSHDTRKDNEPFSALLDWVEVDCRGREDVLALAEQWRTVEAWEAFFRDRIQGAVTRADEEANELVAKVEALRAHADNVAGSLAPSD